MTTDPRILTHQEFKMLVKKHWDWKDHEGCDYDRIRDHDEALRARIAELERRAPPNMTPEMSAAWEADSPMFTFFRDAFRRRR